MPKCKYCKIPFEPRYFNQKYCLHNEECISASYKYAIDKVNKAKKKEYKQKKIELNPKKGISYLQDEINKLARMIDKHFNYSCIDCGKRLDYNKPIAVNGAHRFNVGGNENIRFNLHNIHSSTQWCNCYNTEHKTGYDKGLITRYGNEYFEYIHFEMPLKYKSLKLKSNEIEEALKITRKLIRDFDNHISENDLDGSMLRSHFNKLIGIYM